MIVIRWVLGQIILILDFITSPKPVVREAAAQKAIDDVTASMSMYQFKACPFCVKVRRELKRHALHIELRDAKKEGEFKAELTREGGRHKVPCLRIEKSDNSVEWLYESNDIIAHLKKQFNLT
ncbi:MAG: glutaredoxin family protein [Pseudomonadales bacterium]|jgi:glutaredoxin|tara:strand:- start:306 stop:674 length:369 start_codon:yes stop_codon:yes gene_type:complete